MHVPHRQRPPHRRRGAGPPRVRADAALRERLINVLSRRIDEEVRAAAPGLAVAAVVGIAATFLSVHYRASAMLFALLVGMKTSLKSLVDMGVKPVMLVVSETLLLAVVVAVVAAWK